MSTGTYNYNPTQANMTLAAYSRIGIRRTEITTQHLMDAEQEANLLQTEFSNRIPNLWESQLYSITLTTGTATYATPTNLVAIQAAYITTTIGGSSDDRIIWPYSAFEYSAIPNKTMQAPPTVYWLNMQIAPNITLWPVPDNSATYTLNIRIISQMQDAASPSGVTLNVPYRWLDAWVAALAARLSQIYNAQMADRMDARAERAWQIAATTDQEQVPLFIQGSNMMNYWR